MDLLKSEKNANQVRKIFGVVTIGLAITLSIIRLCVWPWVDGGLLVVLFLCGILTLSVLRQPKHEPLFVSFLVLLFLQQWSWALGLRSSLAFEVARTPISFNISLLVVTFLLFPVAARSTRTFFRRILDALSDLDQFVKSPQTKHTKIILALIFILLIGVSLRIWQIHGLGDNVDGFLHILNAQSLAHGGVNEHHNAQAYTYAMSLFIRIFGSGPLSLHGVNLLSSAALMVLMYFFGKRLGNQITGCISAGLIAVSYWQIGDTGNIRMYTPYLLAMTAFFFFTLRILFDSGFMSFPAKSIQHILRESWRSIVGMIAAFLFALHLHPVAVSVLVPIGLTPFLLLLLVVIRHRKRVWRTQRLLNLVFACGTLLAGIAIIFFIDPSFVTRYFSSVGFNREFFSSSQFLTANEWTSYGWIVRLYGPWLLILTIGATAYRAFRRRDLALWFIWLSFIVVWLETILLFDRYFAPRYIIHLLPLIILLLAVVLERISNALQSVLRLPGLLTALIVVCVVTPWSSVGSVVQKKIGPSPIQEIYYDFKGTIASLPIRSNDALVESVWGPFEFFQQTSKNIISINGLTTDGVGNLLPEAELTRRFVRAVAQHEHGWLLTDQYRFIRWDCRDMLNCQIRDFISLNPSMFRQQISKSDPQLILYEWGWDESARDARSSWLKAQNQD